MVPAGIYMARAISADFGTTPEKKTDYVAVTFQISGGQQDGQQVFWRGYFAGEATKRTIESLRYCGAKMANDDITDTTGIESNAVQLVVEHERYMKDGVEKTVAKVAWVNALGGGVITEQQMDPAKKAAFKAKMLGMVASTRTAGPANGANKATPKGDAPF